MRVFRLGSPSFHCLSGLSRSKLFESKPKIPKINFDCDWSLTSVERPNAGVHNTLTLSANHSSRPLLPPFFSHSHTRLPSKSVIAHNICIFTICVSTVYFCIFNHPLFLFLCVSSTMGATALINGVNGLSISTDLQFGDSTIPYALSNGFSNTPSSVRSDSPSQMSSSTVGNPPEPQPVSPHPPPSKTGFDNVNR